MRVRQMILADTPQAATIADNAFSQDELFAILYPRLDQYPDDLRRWWLLRLKGRLVLPEFHAYVVETESGDEDWKGYPELVGFALWKRQGKDAEASKWQRDSLRSRVERLLLGFEIRYNDFIERASDKEAIQQFVKATEYNFYTVLQEYWHLATLAVSPQFQRRGIGLMLLNYGLEIASREGVPVTLEASLTGQFLYTKAGFQIIERSRIRDDLEGVAMLWEGDASKGRWLSYNKDSSVSLRGLKERGEIAESSSPS